MVDAILRCPKCHAGMMSSRRDGVALDQCAGCRGVFVGEPDLARLIASATAAAVPAAQNGYRSPAYEGRHRRA
ncbi:MAG TPA: zf-TFIIB domain-containing protein [Streptosporangiaceae bacterium]